MSSRSFPQAKRVRSKQEFTEIIRHGTCFNGKMVKLFYRPNGQSYARLGISIGRKYGNAVQRNRFKRLVREAFRHAMDQFPPVDTVVIPARMKDEPSLEICSDDFTRFIETVSEETQK